MAIRSGWARLGIALGVLLALAVIAHLGGGRLHGFFGALHGR